jgi:F-type H+-transporting ATPase subunit epsilon
MAIIHVDIVSAEGEIYAGDASMVFAPAVQGEVGIAPRHAPLLTRLVPGQVRIQSEGEEERVIYITGGILEVQPHMVTILADAALRDTELDEAAALEAKLRAEQVLADRPEGVDLAQAQMELVEAAARYQAAQKLKGKR